MGKKKKTKEQSSGIFDFNDEIIIGINSPKAIENKKKQTKKIQQAKKVHKKSTKQVVNQKHSENVKQATKTNVHKNNKPNKQKKMNPKLKGVIKWTILIILLIGATIYFLMSPLFNIREITVEGESKVNAQQIESLSNLTLGQNIFNFSKIKSKENIKTNPYISTVEINRNLPDKISIVVTERVATFMVEMGSAYMYLDNQGYALELSEDKLELPVLTSLSINQSTFRPGDRLEKEDLIKMEQVISIVNAIKSNELYDRLISIDVADSNNFVLTMTDNKVVYLGDTNNLNVKMLYLKEILEKEQGIEGEIFLSGNNNKEIFFREKI